MVFGDWPSSNFSFNPQGWVHDEAMAAEHGHRLNGMLVGLLTLGLFAWVYTVESRRWVRRTAVAALLLVAFQGLLGGLRVLMDSLLAAKIHGCLAQIFFGLLVTLWLSQRPFFSRYGPAASAPDRHASPVSAGFVAGGFALAALTLVQLVIAATMRHLGAGLAIQTFPLTPQGGLLPELWSAPVAIHFAHRAVALVIFLGWCGWAWLAWRQWSRLPLFARTLFAVFSALLWVQIALGASVIWTGRNAWITTAHVIVGAYTLASLWALAFTLWCTRQRARHSWARHQRAPFQGTRFQRTRRQRAPRDGSQPAAARAAHPNASEARAETGSPALTPQSTPVS